MANLIRKTCTEPYQNRPRFVKDMTKTFSCVFRLTVLIAVHLQNANAKFHKVELRHYSGEAENVYMSLRQIYSGQHVPNFITIGQVCRLYIKKHFAVFFGSQCSSE